MHIDFTPFAILWAVLALIVLALAGYRHMISMKEDETLHIGDIAQNTRQVEVAHKLEVIDKWGKLLTIVSAVYGLLLAVAYTYQTWIQASNLGV